MSLKIATWNVNSLRVRLSQVLNWLRDNQPDVLAIQETKVLDANFPLVEINQAGYQAMFSGQKAYNGVALFSRIEGLYPIFDMPKFADPQRRLLGITVGDIRIINIYVPNGESIQSEKFRYKLNWLSHLKSFLQNELSNYSKLIVLGDFNIAPDDLDVYDPKRWEGQVLCSEFERTLLREILQLGFKDSFRLHPQPEKSFSWWDYRLNAFKRNLGLRIDHIFVSDALSAQCRHCMIDKMPRSWERPSDHTPVIAEFST